MFVDITKINVKAGNGGNGCNSFHRDRRLRKGRPDGGFGGNGGNAIIKSDSSIHTLLDFQYRQHFKAESGGHGSSNHKKGRGGKDYIIKVPAGTILRDAATKGILRDLAEPGESVTIARGGRGGRGNSRNNLATEGAPGEERDLILELKLIADVGIIGCPNAGKSTFITSVSDARPKIASYPFTTKAPVLGVARVYDRDIVIADIPGLIEGAHKGKGLGDKFLRHIERTKLLVHIIDAAAVDGRDPVEDYNTINKELGLYSKSLLEKPQFVVANKTDLTEAKENLEILKHNIKKKIFPISALNGEGIKELMTALIKEL